MKAFSFNASAAWVMLLTLSVIASAQTVDEIIKSGPDIWGEGALKQPGGPSYEYFEKLLPPLRYVEAPFRVYPIVLSAPGAPAKIRLLGDGSMLNPLARQPNWRGEMGIPVTFRVGGQRIVFGSDPKQLIGPKLAGGYLPIVQTHYRSGDEVYAQEVFAGVEGIAPQNGVAFVRFTMPEGKEGKVEVQFEGTEYSEARDNILRNADGKIIACFDEKWEFNKARNTLTTFPKPGDAAILAIYTIPGDQPVEFNRGGTAGLLTQLYIDSLQHCADKWNALLHAGTMIQTPEPIVNNAWRAALIGSYELLYGDDIRYSQGNQYAKLYIGEGGDATRSIALLGHTADAARMMTPLFVYTRKGLEFHQAAFKLQMLAHYHRLTRSDEWIKANQKLWQKEIDVILNGREKSTGMLPREKYCGDIDTMVYSLNSNSNCWRALRDMSILLEDIGDKEQAKKLAETALEYRKVILADLDKAINRTTTPPFVPIALSGEETPYEFIPGTRMGGYWNIMIQYVLGSGVFRFDSQTASDVLGYMQQHGGLVMGLLSTNGDTRNYWQGNRKINDLYGMRYALKLLERDEPDRALVSFYGKLAQGFTRDTFIGCEGSDIKPLDELGRLMYLPPNSASNASFLQQLRYLLVQDYDLDDDGRPETLRLAFATPRKWLEHGARISVTNAPTLFGEITYTIQSAINDGHVDVDITLPDKPAAKALFRLRLPKGFVIDTAAANGQAVYVGNDETVDLSGLKGNVRLVAKVLKNPARR